MNYSNRIKAIAPNHDARHVEAFMRVEHSTLDGLCPRQFASEVKIAVDCIETGGVEQAERLAESFGMRKPV